MHTRKAGLRRNARPANRNRHAISGVDLGTVEIVGVLHDERLARRHVITHEQAEDVQVGLLDESSPQNTQTANDDTDWNLVLVNYENAIPENYEPKLVEVPGGEKVDERIYDPLMEMLEAAKEGNWDQL